MESGERKGSRADYVFGILESDILSGTLGRGELLTEQRISEKLGVSRTPVREALNRLMQEELLEESGKGLRVVGITEEDVRDVLDIRLRLEGLSANICASVITDAQLQTLRETLELQEFYTEKNAAGHIRDMDSQFHELIFAFCGRRTLRSVLTAMHRKMLRYRKISVEDPGRAREAAAEHRAIFDAIAAHDARLAEERTVLHIEHAKKSILATLKL